MARNRIESCWESTQYNRAHGTRNGPATRILDHRSLPGTSFRADSALVIRGHHTQLPGPTLGGAGRHGASWPGEFRMVSPNPDGVPESSDQWSQFAEKPILRWRTA